MLGHFTTVFVDSRLWKTKNPRKRFQNFHQSCVLLTDRIEIHQSQPDSTTQRRLEGHTSGCNWWILIRSVNTVEALLTDTLTLVGGQLYLRPPCLKPSVFLHSRIKRTFPYAAADTFRDYVHAHPKKETRPFMLLFVPSICTVFLRMVFTT